jgi:hypothetical protein
MAQRESFGFKNATDKATYEADYADRARDHQAEERRYINSDRDANLFQNVRHKVLIAGFKHGQQCPGKDKWKRSQHHHRGSRRLLWAFIHHGAYGMAFREACGHGVPSFQSD